MEDFIILTLIILHLRGIEVNYWCKFLSRQLYIQRIVFLDNFLIVFTSQLPIVYKTLSFSAKLLFYFIFLYHQTFLISPLYNYLLSILK